MFDFDRSNNKRVMLAANGHVRSITPIDGHQPVAATKVVIK